MRDSAYLTEEELIAKAQKFVESMSREQLIRLLEPILPKYPNDPDKCPHLNTEATHPYGWHVCLDCGRCLD